MTRPRITQINLSPTLGGAEVYTAFFSRALEALGWPTRVLVRPGARFWSDLDFGGIQRVPVTGAAGVGAALGTDRIVVVHGSLDPQVMDVLRDRFVVGLAHQALYDARRPDYYDRADLLLPVSRHVAATLAAQGLTRIHAEPLLGIADLERCHSDGPIAQGPLCEWDKRKWRDRMLRWIGPKLSKAADGIYVKRPGLTLGLVSRLAPLKQFPALFAPLVPVMTRHPTVNLDVFGIAVGYKSLRELRSVLAPLGNRVRFWGHQRDVVRVYRAIDYLLTGLPEREALGLNAIESVASGTPVLAIDAPPFTETMDEGVTGFLYRDPRADAGRDFERALDGILAGRLRPDMAAAGPGLARFSLASFAQRVEVAMLAVAALATH